MSVKKVNLPYLLTLPRVSHGFINCNEKKSKAVPLHAMQALGEKRGIAATHS
jgi:hypothetical protein